MVDHVRLSETSPFFEAFGGSLPIRFGGPVYQVDLDRCTGVQIEALARIGQQLLDEDDELRDKSVAVVAQSFYTVGVNVKMTHIHPAVNQAFAALENHDAF